MDLTYSHVDILVFNLETASQYYRRVLGFRVSPTQVWQREEFHVRFAVLFKSNERFMLVEPISGNLKQLIDEKGEGTIYRYCFSTPNLRQCYRELIDQGVQPEDENGRPITEEELDSPAGTPILWLPKAFGGLSIEILEHEPLEENLARLRQRAV